MAAGIRCYETRIYYIIASGSFDAPGNGLVRA